MTLYEIDNAMMSLIDNETGEIVDYEQFEALIMSKEEKIDNTAKWIIELEAEAKMVKERADELTKRAQATKKKAERLREFLQEYLQGEKRKTADYTIGYRKTKAVEITDEKAAEMWLLEHCFFDCMKTTTTLNKTAMRAHMEFGDKIPGAELVERQTMQVK